MALPPLVVVTVAVAKAELAPRSVTSSVRRTRRAVLELIVNLLFICLLIVRTVNFTDEG
jgi:hypothetical protein